MTVGTGVPVAVPAGCVDFLVGALLVLTGVRKRGAKGVLVANEVAPACKSGQGCKCTGNCRQFEGSEQTFKLKDVD